VASELLQKQWRFARAVPLLLFKAHSMGLEVSLGEVSRSDEQAEINAMGGNGREMLAGLVERAFPLLAAKIRNNGRAANGIRASLHTKRLAIDLQLFRDGVWCGGPQAPRDIAPYAQLGAYWKTLGDDHCWGGDFGDTPHYSISHDGAR
jgi:hypothetical protein